jgi:hypothetical protein
LRQRTANTQRNRGGREQRDHGKAEMMGEMHSDGLHSLFSKLRCSAPSRIALATGPR